MAKYLKKNLAIRSHCSRYTEKSQQKSNSKIFRRMIVYFCVCSLVASRTSTCLHPLRSSCRTRTWLRLFDIGGQFKFKLTSLPPTPPQTLSSSATSLLTWFLTLQTSNQSAGQLNRSHTKTNPCKNGKTCFKVTDHLDKSYRKSWVRFKVSGSAKGRFKGNCQKCRTSPSATAKIF